MSWKFWKKKRLENVMFEVISTERPSSIPMSTLFRWYCYDMEIPNPNKLAALLGLNGISEDVEEMEKEDSLERLKAIVPILPFLTSIASVNSMVISEVQGESIKSQMNLNDKDLDDMLAPVRDIIGHISISALITGFSAAIALGVVHSSGAIASEVDITKELGHNE